MGDEESDIPNEWYVLLNNKRLGPYAFEWLVEAASISLLKETDLVRCPGQTPWLTAGSVPGLLFSASTGRIVSKPTEVAAPKLAFTTSTGGMVSEIGPVIATDEVASFHLTRHGRLVWVALATIVIILGMLIVSTEFSTTLVPGASQYAMNALDRIRGGPTGKLERTLNSIPVYAILKQIDPKAHDRILQELSRRSAGGDSQDEILSSARNGFFKILQPYLMHATDAEVLENMDIVIAYMDGLKGNDGESCVSLVDEPKGAKLTANLRKQFPVIFKREMELHAEVLRAAGRERPNVPTGRQVEPYLSKAFVAIGSRPGIKLSLLAQDKLAPSEYEDYCQVTLALFKEIRQLPKQESVQVLRYLYSLGKR